VLLQLRLRQWWLAGRREKVEEGNLKGLSEEGGETKVKLGEGGTGKGEQKSDSLGKERRTEERKKEKKEREGRTGKGKLFGECGKCSKCRRRRHAHAVLSE